MKKIISKTLAGFMMACVLALAGCSAEEGGMKSYTIIETGTVTEQTFIDIKQNVIEYTELSRNPIYIDMSRAVTEKYLEIPRDWLRGCRSLISINLPDGLTTIGDEAFASCSSLTSINLPDSLTTIGDEAFYYCRSLTSINLPDSLTTLRDNTFSRCSSLTSINMPDGLTTIGDWTFSDCSSLTSIKLPDSLTTLGSGTFSGCSSLTTITYAGTISQWRSLLGYPNGDFDRNVPSELVVICSDGTVGLRGN